jgi:hypothetical protein
MPRRCCWGRAVNAAAVAVHHGQLLIAHGSCCQHVRDELIWVNFEAGGVHHLNERGRRALHAQQQHMYW